MGCEFVFTCQNDSEQLCVNEMKSISKDVKILKWLDGGVGIAGNEFLDFHEISKIFREEKPVFLRHIFPVEFEFDFLGNYSAFDALINTYKEKTDKNLSLSVQIRSKNDELNSLRGTAYNLKEIKFYILKQFEDGGYTYNKSNPQVINSVFISDGKVYAGISSGEENLSVWSGGMRHYAFNEEVISRAEFKLLELFECFPNLNEIFTSNKNSEGETPSALDLGASPGGWTKILVEKGFDVTAVDPNKLSEALSGCPNVRYYKGLVENFIDKNKKRGKSDLFDSYDLIVNDMRMHVVQSAKVMIEACGYLKEGGYAVMTFKLNKNNKTAVIRQGLNILKEKYDILFVKQLFHNRLEITVVLRKKL